MCTARLLRDDSWWEMTSFLSSLRLMRACVRCSLLNAAETHTQPSGGAQRPESRRMLTKSHSSDCISQFPEPGFLAVLELLAILLCLDPTWLFFLLSQHEFNYVTVESFVLLLGG